MRRSVMALAGALALGGCSTVMEANRPAAVNLHRFAVGERRFDVVANIGAPIASDKDGDRSCDLYKLFTHGVSDVGKGAIIVTEAAADVFTLGLAEVLATPGEAMTKAKLHTVVFCYGADGLLASVTESGEPVAGSPEHIAAPSATPASTPAPAPAVAAALDTLAPTPAGSSKPAGVSPKQ